LLILFYAQFLTCESFFHFCPNSIFVAGIIWKLSGIIWKLRLSVNFSSSAKIIVDFVLSKESIVLAYYFQYNDGVVM
jgi:hypothetical protein